MISTNLKLPICFILLIGIIVACQKEIIEVPDDSEANNIEDAKRWYESNVFKGIETKGGNMPYGKLRANPDWSRAIFSNHNESKTVEVPLIFDQEIGITSKDSYEKWEKSKNESLLNSKTLLVIETKNNNKTGFLMTIAPDMDFRINNDYEAFNSSYKKWQKGFSGAILYHHYDGSYSNGWKFTNGKVTNKIIYVGEDKLLIEFLPKGCTHYFWVTTITDCTYKKATTGCVVVYQSWDYMYSICDYNSGGGGSGGYEPGTQSSTPTLDLIYHANSDLSLTQKAILESAVTEFKSKNPIITKIWESLLSSRVKIIFKINPNTPIIPGTNQRAPAYLSVNGDSIGFRDESCITEFNLEEELIHKYQRYYYGSQFNSIKRNYEFEAKVLRDVSCDELLCPFIASQGFSSPIDIQLYTQWIIELQRGETTLNYQLFNSFCSRWSYPSPPNNYCDQSFTPSVLSDCLSNIFYQGGGINY